MPEIIGSEARYGLPLERGDYGVCQVTISGVWRFKSRIKAAAQIGFDEVAFDLSATSRQARRRESADFAACGVLVKANQVEAASWDVGKDRGEGG